MRISDSECSDVGRALTRRVELLKGLTHRGDAGPTAIDDGTQSSKRIRGRVDHGRAVSALLHWSRANLVEFRRCSVEPDGRSLRSHVGVKYPSEKSINPSANSDISVTGRTTRVRSSCTVLKISKQSRNTWSTVLYVNTDYRRNVTRRSLKQATTVGKSEYSEFYNENSL